MTLHTKISFVKSGVRIAGAFFLLGTASIILFSICFIAAELIGIVEEFYPDI